MALDENATEGGGGVDGENDTPDVAERGGECDASDGDTPDGVDGGECDASDDDTPDVVEGGDAAGGVEPGFPRAPRVYWLSRQKTFLAKRQPDDTSPWTSKRFRPAGCGAAAILAAHARACGWQATGVIDAPAAAGA